MSIQIALFAPSAQRLRAVAESWTQSLTFDSTYDARAWLGAIRLNLVSLLDENEPYLLAVVRDDRGAKRVLEVARAWPHAITDNGARTSAPDHASRRIQTTRRTR